MSYFEAAFLGLIQGLTEFLPISSSAHLRIVGEFLPSATDPEQPSRRLPRSAPKLLCFSTSGKTSLVSFERGLHPCCVVV